MELALAILLISALTTNGLLALWTATLRRHWFLRTAIYLTCLSPLLLVPAFEPFIALAIQGSVIAGGVRLRRWLRRRISDEPDAIKSPLRWRFSLLTMLQLMAILGLASAIAPQVASLNRFAWQSIVAIGICSGITSAMACWAASIKGLRLALGGVAALATALALGALLGAIDWFVLSTISSGGWVQDIPGMGVVLLMGDRNADELVVEWLLILPASAFATLVVVMLWQRRRLTVGAQQRRRWAIALWNVCLVAALIVLGAPAVTTLFVLLNPERIPVVVIPAPNGNDDLRAARELLPGNPVVDSGTFDRNVAAQAELNKAVTETKDSIERVEKGLQADAMRQLDYSLTLEAGFEEIQPTRSLSRAMDAAGKLAEMQGNYDESLRWHLNNMKHGFAARRGGLIVDDLVGVACAGIGCAGIFEIKDNLTAQQCEESRIAIEELLAAAEPFPDVAYRDRVWTQHALGWMAHLSQYLFDDPDANLGFELARLAELARCRLLMTELALQAYKQRHGQLPNTAEEFLAKFPSALPIDPFSPNGDALQFKPIAGGYVLYSLGRDGVDNQGKPPADDMSAGWSEPGDLRLDAEYGPRLQPLPTASPSDAGEDESEEPPADEN